MVARDYLVSEVKKVDLGQQAQLAVAAHRALLVAVVPNDRSMELGQRWGAFLNFGSDAQLAPLGLCRLVYASQHAAQTRFSGLTPGLPAEPVLVWQALDGRVAWARLPLPDRSKRRDLSMRESEQAQDADMRLGMMELAGTLSQLAGDELVGQDTTALAARARAELRDQAIPGGRWARSMGCGERYEDETEPQVMGRCGMGYLPELSRRFLSFMAKGADR